MSFDKVAELATEFAIKIAENQLAGKAPADKKASDFKPEEREFIKSLSEKDNNPALDENELDEKIWKRAKKTVKKYWKKYDEPWAVVYDVYRKMGGRPAKKSKKKKSSAEALLQKYSYYGEIKNTLPPQNNVLPSSKAKATQAVYNLVNSLYAEKQLGHFTDNVAIEDSFNKIVEFYQSLLQEGKRPKFEMYDEAVSDPTGFSILEEHQLATSGARHPTKLDKMLSTKSDVLRRHLNESNDAVRELKQEIRG